ncbi:prolyl oligopeptidase family serine peptidase [Gemmatimonas groenlandica]|uniref:Prolyl oligopeptidase family serine peptidase n=1 Tax=Gemmatimonas groenlandica TaxID=2732249 RepID=A0A6M4IXB3_9BACT|nr:prolyl oligopeptidase family serine peptidase [Gemmatimonas groenlandica]QJR37542.1 prolyl oligopeptidase family serine peptidase [Gemmatimonas groenlandica]
MTLHHHASRAIHHAKLLSTLTVAWSVALSVELSVTPRVVSAQGTLADYRRAAAINQRFANLTTGITSGLSWVGRTNQAVYRVSVPGGNRFVKVDADQWSKQPAFDHAAVAAGLSVASGQRYTDITLPFPSVVFVENGLAIEGNASGGRYRCAVNGGACARIGDATPAEGSAAPNGGDRGAAARGGAARCGGAAPGQGQGQPAENVGVYSPDCRLVAFVQNYNIAIRNAPVPNAAPNGMPNYTLLSTDGSEGDAYVQNSIVWSPDSRKLVAYRQVPGYNRMVTFVRSSPTDQLQPKTENTRSLGGFASNYAKPGDVLATNQPSIFDVETKRQIVIDRALFPNPYAISRPVWRKDNGAYAFHYNQRGHMTYRVLEVNANTGAVRPMIDEVTKSFFMYSDAGHNFIHDLGSNCRLAQGGGACSSYTGDDLLWVSERDGWNHLYLMDGRTGRVKNQITKGDWVMRGVDSVDVANRQIYFRASGMNQGQDPYFVHFYRINFDGTGLVAYTEANGMHAISWSPDRTFYIDTYSRVDMPPVVELKRATDRRTLVLEQGDMSAAVKAGFRAPEVFVAKGRDGTTDIWGFIVRPVTFDAKKKYPVIEQIYAGPHDNHVPKSWGGGQNLTATAELGFVLAQVDGMGTSNRSKRFHDVAWKNLKDAGFPDRILWHKAINQKYAWYDTDRVGIYGTSAGGQNAAGAVFFFPEFYDVAVANSGCHDNRMDKIWWNEAWMGEMGAHYDSNSNVGAAKNLKGHLYLTVGELDTNVDPSSTLQVADALIRAGKDFDLLVVPNGGHGATGAQGTRKRNDFFVRWLLGVTPPDWNSGITAAEPTPVGAAQGSRGDFEFPSDELPEDGFFARDPSFSSARAWWF